MSKRCFTNCGFVARIDEGNQDRAFLHRVDHVQRRWLHSENYVGVADQSVTIGRESDILECGIDDAGGISRARLHVQLGAQFGQLADNGRHQRHASFVRMCFLQNGDVDVHGTLQLLTHSWSASARPMRNSGMSASERPHRLFTARVPYRPALRQQRSEPAFCSRTRGYPCRRVRARNRSP